MGLLDTMHQNAAAAEEKPAAAAAPSPASQERLSFDEPPEADDDLHPEEPRGQIAPEPEGDDEIPGELVESEDDSDELRSEKRRMFAAMQRSVQKLKARQQKEREQILSQLRDPKQVEALAAYQRTLSGQGEAPQLKNPYAPDGLRIQKEEGDGGFDPQALNDTRAVAWDLVAGEFYPAVEKGFSSVAARLAQIERQIAEQATEKVARKLGIEEINHEAVNAYVQKGLSYEDAMFLAHRDVVVKERNGARAVKQARTTPEEPRQPPLRRSSSQRAAGLRGKSFVERIDHVLERDRDRFRQMGGAW